MLSKIFKNKNTLIIIFGMLLGGILIIYGNSDKSSGDFPITNENNYTSSELEIYTETLENKVSKFLEKIGGVSNVSGIITIENSKENVYATEGSNFDYVILQDSSGNQSTIKLTEINATVRGIAVVCNYSSEELRQQMISTLASLFNIGTNRISVINAS